MTFLGEGKLSGSQESTSERRKKIVQQKTHDGSIKLDDLPIHEWLKFMVNVGKYPIHEASGKQTHPKKPGNSVFGDLFGESYGK